MNNRILTPQDRGNISRFLWATKSTIQKEIRRYQQCGESYTVNNHRIPFYCGKLFCYDCQKRKLRHYESRYKSILGSRPKNHKFYFLTIAPKSVNGDRLNTAIKEIQNLYKSLRYKIGKIATGTIARLEVGYNNDTNKYKPHYHIILETTSGLAETELLDTIMRKANTTAGIQSELNKWGITDYTAETGTLSLNLLQITKGTESAVLHYTLKPTELFYSAETVETLIRQIDKNTRFITARGTLKALAKADTNTQAEIAAELTAYNDTERHAITLGAELVLMIYRTYGIGKTKVGGLLMLRLNDTS